jgi:hypothetical protein
MVTYDQSGCKWEKTAMTNALRDLKEEKEKDKGTTVMRKNYAQRKVKGHYISNTKEARPVHQERKKQKWLILAKTPTHSDATICLHLSSKDQTVIQRELAVVHEASRQLRSTSTQATLAFVEHEASVIFAFQCVD